MTKIKPDQLKVVRVFIGSPGDLVNERYKFRDVIEELNQTAALEHCVHLEAVGWEDTQIGPGRPQERINEDLKSCQLIVLALWRRWGSETGEYSSGFEEEFKWAAKENKARRLLAGIPGLHNL